jgi:hypothetical protein
LEQKGEVYLVKFAILLATAILSLAIEIERRKTTPQAQQQLAGQRICNAFGKPFFIVCW